MEIVDVRYLGSNDQFQSYSPTDTALINTSLITANFGKPNDYIEYFIKDLSGNVLSSNYYTTQYKLGNLVDPITGTTTQLILNPEEDARTEGYDRGIVNVKYNFLSRYLLSGPDPAQSFWIKEISVSRTEIKVARQNLSNTQLLESFNTFNAVLAADAYYPTFYLNFGADVLLIAVNAAYIEEDGNGYILFKLYEPLPVNINLKSTFWVVTEVADPAIFSVSINALPEVVRDTTDLRGPNFKVNLNNKVNQTTQYYSYSSLFATIVSSSYQQLQSMMAEKGIQINVDYSSFDNFVHFSSATERLYNFVYKLQQIESASAGLGETNTTTAKVVLQKQIDGIITNFDGYEYYLYFTSASTAWPKRNATIPYNLYSVTSSQAVNWLGTPNTIPTAGTTSLYWSASYYDNLNQNLLVNSIPSYILDDDQNAPYLTFLNMIGQHFDNIWIYLKDVTNRYSAENNPFVGISMDQVSEALQSFGIQLYTNTSIADNLYYSMLGLNETGSNLPVTSSNYATVVYGSSSISPLPGNAFLSASLFLPPFGDEKINRYVLTFPSATLATTSSFQSLSSTQLTDEVYKRIYHNLAYLLKTRGTERGVKALIATYGIPNDILTVHEYGGYDYLDVPGIQEISNTRILTGSFSGSFLSLSSSLLSPFVTRQYYSNNLEKTSVNVEVAFSPADSINASITSSGYITASNEPGYFNIMQYIGAPALQYSSSYIPLDNLSKTYFDNEYKDRYNVWDFIRIIKYYNNSIFKMLRDWVPARANPSTGIVIKSHMLERNKYPRKEPTGITSSYDADYELLRVSGSDGGAVQGNTNYVQAIPIQYSAYSTPLSGAFGTVYQSSSDDVQKYTGEFSGSYIQISDNYFSQESISSYIYPWTSSVAPSSHGGQSIMFITYSISSIFQNVTGSVLSQRFLDLDYNSSQLAPVNYGLITQSIEKTQLIGNINQSQQPYSQYAQYQDYNQSFKPITIPRYSGSTLSGLYYNTYSFGDVSYGAQPVINYYSGRLGLFAQIATSSFLPGKVNANLIYFADVSGGLFELNQNNRNWEDVQNTFKAGTLATIKQFDNKKYSNQVFTDGVKRIYNSGYNYTPQLYFFTGSDKTLYFQYTGDAAVASFIGYNTGVPNAFISGVVSPYYGSTLLNSSTREANIYGIFDAADPDNANFGKGTTGVWANYTASQAGQNTFTVDFDINIEFPDPSISIHSGSFSWGAYLDGSTLIGNLQRVQFTSSYTAGGFSTGSVYSGGNLVFEYFSGVGGSDVYNGPFNYYLNGIFQGTIGTAASSLTLQYYNYRVPSGPDAIGYFVDAVSGDIAAYFRPTTGLEPYTLIEDISSGGGIIPAINVSGSTLSINYTTPATSLGPSDKVIFQFKQEGISTSNYTASVSTGKANSSLSIGTIAVGQGGYPYATASYGNFIFSTANITTQQSKITLSENLSQYFGYQFIPYFESGSTIYSSSLYSTYGDVSVTFNPQFGDKIILFDINGIVQDLDVLESQLVGGKLEITTIPNVVNNWTTAPYLINRFLLLRRYKDEQNVILTFNKPPGKTSYGFLIPSTTSPQVTNNINTLQAAVQAQLLTM